MRSTAIVAALAACIALVVSAEGAQPVSGSVFGGAYDELLPVLVRGRTFVPSFKSRIEYDDNIFTEESNEVSQWKFVIEPKLDLHILRDLGYFGLSYQYSLQIYEDRNPRTDQSHDLSLTWNHKWAERFETRVRDRFRKMFEPELVEVTVQEGIAGERVVTRRLRNDCDYNVFSPSAIIVISPTLTGSLTYENTYVDYDDPDVSLWGDRDENSGAASVNYVLTQKTSLTGFYRYQAIDYKYDDPKVDSTSNIATVGAIHQFSPTLTGNLQVGVERREFDNYMRGDELVTGQTQTAPYINASIRAPLSETIATEIGYTYRIEETTQSMFLSQELQSVYLGLSQSFTDRFSAVFNATLDFGQYNVDEARYPETQSNFNDQTVLFALLFRYRIKPNWHAELGWRFTDVDSDFPGNSYTRNRPFIGINAIF
jgi:hypothetical protein